MDIVQLSLDLDTPKLCECGCGLSAPLARATQRSRGVVKGQPQRYIRWHRGRINDLQTYVWAHIDTTSSPTGCWLWTGNCIKAGYGSVCYNHKSYRVHRLVWEWENGPIEPELEICHSCDNPPCCNLLHLFKGTHRENMADASRKGRIVVSSGSLSPAHPMQGNTHWTRLRPEDRPRGEHHGQSKLTTAIVLAIRASLAAGVRPCDLARQFGVGPSTINHIKQGSTWGHLK